MNVNEKVSHDWSVGLPTLQPKSHSNISSDVHVLYVSCPWSKFQFSLHTIAALSEWKWSGVALVSSEVTSPQCQALCSSEKPLDPAESCPAVLISAGSASAASPGGGRTNHRSKSPRRPTPATMNIIRASLTDSREREKERMNFSLRRNPEAENPDRNGDLNVLTLHNAETPSGPIFSCRSTSECHAKVPVLLAALEKSAELPVL